MQFAAAFTADAKAPNHLIKLRRKRQQNITQVKAESSRMAGFFESFQTNS